MARTRRSFGRIRRFRSGRYQASYTGPDTRVHLAPTTFDAKVDAEAWLADRRREIARDVWLPPGVSPDVGRNSMLFGAYADTWLADRPLKPRTRELYQSLLDRRILPRFGQTPLKAITPAAVRRWHADMGEDTPTARAHAYGLLKGIMATALSDELIATNPCHVRGGSTTKRRRQIKPATLDEITALVEAMPARYQTMTLLAVWTGLRFGEITELRRKDIDTKSGVLHVRRAVAHTSKGPVLGLPKSDAGVRDVHVPPHLRADLKRHVLEHAGRGRDGLLFPAASGGHLAPSTLYKVFRLARQQAGRPDLRWHDLRHTGAVLAASTGASLRELMTRMGHTTPAMALRYQHTAEGRDAEIAEKLSRLAQGESH
jgi:integrase